MLQNVNGLDQNKRESRESRIQDKQEYDREYNEKFTLKI